MNRKTITATLAAIALAGITNADPVASETISGLTFSGTGTISYVNTAALPHLADSTVILTNCWAGNGTATQNLDGCTINLYVGNSITSRTYTGMAISTNDGTFWASIVLPPVRSTAAEQTLNWTGIVLELTNGTTLKTYRDEKRLYIRQKLR